MSAPLYIRNLVMPMALPWWVYSVLATLAVVLGLFLMPAPTAPAVEASTGDILVLSNRHEVNFPTHVAFDLTAESQREITEVRLHYRVVASGIWAYAYPTFSPGRQIAAHINVRTTGVDYVPPGTDLEYYYVIRDALGNEHQTPSVVFEYMDSRFQWERTQVGPLVLLHHDVSQSSVTQVAGQVDAELQRITDLLRLEPDQSIKGVIYNRRGEAEGAFPFQSRTISEGHVFQGFAFPGLGVFVGIGLQPRLIVHESAHMLLHEALGPGGRSLPAWLDEGFASYVEPGSTPYSGQSLSSRGLPLRAMSTIPGTPDAISTFYLKSESVVAYLIEAHGVEDFQELLDELGRGRPINDAIFQTYGFDIDGLDARWTAEADGPPAPRGAPTGPSPFVFFDTWIIGALALVVMSVLLVRYVVNRLRPSADPAEGLQPWEDPDLWDDDEEEEDDRPGEYRDTGPPR